MKLFYSPFHDFVHKVLVTVHEAGLAGEVELVASFPFRNLAGEWVRGEYDVTALNPTGKVPFLALDDGTVLYPSQVVVEYLDSVSRDTRLFPAAGPERFDALRRLALGDAVFEFAVQMSMEGWRPPEERRGDLYEWLWPKITRSFDRLEREIPAYRAFDIGDAGVLQGLSYVDGWAGRRDDLPLNPCRRWRDAWPALAAWFEEAVNRPAVRSHYGRNFEGDVSPQRHAAAVEAVLASRSSAS